MRHYKRITYWENQRRLHRLTEFCKSVNQYVENSNSLQENTAALEARSSINLALREIVQIVEAAEISPRVTVTPPPMIGGYVSTPNVLLDFFNLHRFPTPIPPSVPYDFLQQAIGVYLADRKASFWRTVNPLWWISQFLEWFALLPFYLLGSAGFNRQKIGASTIGRLLWLVFYWLPIIASILTILQFDGWPDLGW